jgi:hypothetical protein
MSPWMSLACAEPQAWAARQTGALRHDDLRSMLDVMLEELNAA